MIEGIAELLVRAPRADTVPEFVDRRTAELEHQHASRTPEAWLEGRARLREAVSQCIGEERIPHSTAVVRHVGEIRRPEYTIEKLVFEALPGLPVPALLYLPQDASGPVPAVVHAPGHWMENAKLEPDLQRMNTWLARSGVAVLCFDPLGQGERRIGWHQHGQLGTLLTGFTTLGVMVTESRRALGVLADHPAIDAQRLGHIGASGGGLTGIFVAALDERAAATAIVTFANTHRSEIRTFRGSGWDSAVCLCCQLPGLCAIASIGQIMALAAPRALLQVNALGDLPFPIDGAREVADDVHRCYEAAGARDLFAYAEPEGGHGFLPGARSATVDWLCARLGVPTPPSEQADEPLLDAPYATTYLDVADDDAARQDFTRAQRVEGECLDANVDSNEPLLEVARSRAVALRERRVPPTLERLERAVGPFPEAEPARAIVLKRLRVSDGYAERVEIASEAGVTLDAFLLLPGSWSDEAAPVVVMLDEHGKQAALDSPEAALARDAGCAVLAVDLRGTGESACAEWEQATTCFMLDRDLLNQRVWDARRVVEALRNRAYAGQQIDRGRIALWGRGSFGLVALIAAALDRRVAGAGAGGTVRSLEELLVPLPDETPMLYRYGLLELLDVADVEELIRPRPVVRDDLAALIGSLA